METLFAEKRFYTIGEVASMLELKPHVLRYWESEFEQVSPGRGPKSKQRRYERGDIELLHLIKTLLRDRGYTLAGARSYLSDQDHSSAWNGDSLRTGRGEIKKLVAEIRRQKA